MKVGFGCVGHVVVEHYVDSLNVDSSPHEVGGHHDTCLEFLELSVRLDPIVL